MGVLLPHVGPAWTSQHSELHEDHFKDDLKNHFERWSGIFEEITNFKNYFDIFDKRERWLLFHKEDVGNHVAFEWTPICCSGLILVPSFQKHPNVWDRKSQRFCDCDFWCCLGQTIHRVLQGRHRGRGGNFAKSLQFSGPLFLTAKWAFSTSKLAPPWRQPPEAPLAPQGWMPEETAYRGRRRRESLWNVLTTPPRTLERPLSRLRLFRIVKSECS